MDNCQANSLPQADAFADPELCAPLLERLDAELDAPLRFMEVCGTHTVSIFRSGLRSLLPSSVAHLSGPGCPVCVTHDREIAACMALAEKPGVVVATFGDLLRVPGPGGTSLKRAKAFGAEVEVVYSPLDALALAKARPERNIVFLGVGFETTAPTVAATVHMAEAQGLKNFSVLSFHKLVPPALAALLAGEETQQPASGPAGFAADLAASKSPLTAKAAREKDREKTIDAFLLPGHVSTILGVEPYRFMVDVYGKPGVIGGFEPADILQSLLLMVEMRKKGKPAIINQYRRAVSDAGNPRAREILFSVFERADALWRGLGVIPDSGLTMRREYEAFDAWKRFDLALPDVPEVRGCSCGDVLRGRISPAQCPLFGTACTPSAPVGPCMVSTEGSCAAYFRYQG